MLYYVVQSGKQRQVKSTKLHCNSTVSTVNVSQKHYPADHTRFITSVLRLFNAHLLRFCVLTNN